VSRIESSGGTGSGAIRHKLAAALGSPVWALKGGVQYDVPRICVPEFPVSIINPAMTVRRSDIGR